DGLPVAEIPAHITRQKALAVLQAYIAAPNRSNTTIIAADTIVVLYNTIIGNPVDREDAIRILLQLSGRQHAVITGVVILDNGKEIAFADTTEVWFHELSKE